MGKLINVSARTMTPDAALQFLRDHPYISVDSPQDVITELAAVREYFVQPPQEECIPLFLDLFADHMGWGIFQVCDDIFSQFSDRVIAQHLEPRLRSDRPGTRWWAAHWALQYPEPVLRDGLMDIVNSKTDGDAHYFAFSALGDILGATGDPEVAQLVKARTSTEADDELRELLNEILQGR